MQGKETELGQKKFDLEKQLEVAEAETLTVRSDLKLALKRVEDLQAAIAGEIDSDNSDDNSDRYIAGIYIIYFPWKPLSIPPSKFVHKGNRGIVSYSTFDVVDGRCISLVIFKFSSGSWNPLDTIYGIQNTIYYDTGITTFQNNIVLICDMKLAEFSVENKIRF